VAGVEFGVGIVFLSEILSVLLRLLQFSYSLISGLLFGGDVVEIVEVSAELFTGRVFLMRSYRFFAVEEPNDEEGEEDDEEEVEVVVPGEFVEVEGFDDVLQELEHCLYYN